MIRIQLTTEPEEKSKITNAILRSLPEWFGIEEAIRNYVQSVREHLFYSLYDQDRPIGFLSIKLHNPYTSEIYVMGIFARVSSYGFGYKVDRTSGKGFKKARIQVFDGKNVRGVTFGFALSKNEGFLSQGRVLSFGGDQRNLGRTEPLFDHGKKYLNSHFRRRNPFPFCVAENAKGKVFCTKKWEK